MSNPEYKDRIIDTILSEEMKAFGGVVITGPRMCGKTATAEHICPSGIYLQDKTEYDRYRTVSDIDPSILLNVPEYPLLIDEWQMIPELWDETRLFIDSKGTKGIFILTGSNTIDQSKISHSGIGRISTLRMYTMSLFEMGYSSGIVSLAHLFDTKEITTKRSNNNIQEIAEIIVSGGWPSNIGTDLQSARKAIAEYCKTMMKSDINIERKHDPRKLTALLKALSRNESTCATSESLMKELVSRKQEMNIKTLYDYISALKKIYIVDDLPAWSPKLRSKTTVRVSDVKHLTDPSIAAHFLNAGPDDLLRDPNTFGLLFESLVIRDLRVYAQGLGADIYHYRDADGLEADAVIHTPDGRWAALEVKLSDKYLDDAAKNLLKLKNKIESEPEFLAVVLPLGYSYRRNDGVFVIPITLLGP